jgi:hypothetical protein
MRAPKTHLSPDARAFVGAIPFETSPVKQPADDRKAREVTTLSTIKKLAATSAIAGSLGLAALALGSGLAAAAPATGSGSSTSSSTSSTSGTSSTAPKVGSISRTALADSISKQNAAVQAQLSELRGKSESVSIADMFKMQMTMNKLSQMSEMSSSIMSAQNQAISSVARNLKG